MPLSPSPNSLGIQMVKGPWTPAAKQMALEREVQGHYADYFARTLKTRRWSPWHDFPFEEMSRLGGQLSTETVNLIEAFMGIEEYVADYTLAGVELFRRDRTRRNMQLQWGAEEARHGTVWELVLRHSMARTEAQLHTYLAKIQASRWKAEDHGIDTPLSASAYSMVQERATYFNYQQLRVRIREDYGLPSAPIDREKVRGFEIGASEACRRVGQDEIAHHGLFLKVIQTYIRYFPSRTFEALSKIFLKFEMPSLRIIPNAQAFLRAVLRTNLYSHDIHREKVHTPILNSLGLEGDAAFKRATQTAGQLSDDLGPDNVTLSRTGEWKFAYEKPRDTSVFITDESSPGTTE